MIPRFLASKPIEAWSREDWAHRVDTETDETLAHAFALEGRLPPDFAHWDLRDGAGDTVAHYAGRSGVLPDGFDQWHMLNDRGWSVSHSTAASKNGRFPENFDGWACVLAGMTVLGVLIMAGRALPDNFTQYDYLDGDGDTIESLARRFQNPVVRAQLEARRVSDEIESARENKETRSRIVRNAP